MANNNYNYDDFPPISDRDFDDVLTSFDSGPDLNAPNPHDQIEALGFGDENITDRPLDNWTELAAPTDSFGADEPISRVGKFLTEQINAMRDSGGDSRLSINSTFFKNQQTEWVGDFNSKISEQGLNDAEKLLTKPNGFFFVESDTVEGVLQRDFGLSADKAQEFSKHFELGFIGWTKSNKAKSKNPSNEAGPSNRFKSSVLAIKDPQNPESVQVFNEVQAHRTAVVEKALKERPTLESATEALVAKAPSIIEAYNNKNGTVAFTGVGETLFLNYSATLKALNDVPGLKGAFKVEPLNVFDSSINYRGYSSKLDSYFDDKVALHKVVTKDPEKLPQDQLEKMVREHLEGKPDVDLSKTPVEAFNEAKPSDTSANLTKTEGAVAPATNSNNLDKPVGSPNSNPKDPEDSDDFEKSDSYKKSQDQDDEPEKVSLGKALTDVLTSTMSFAVSLLIELLKKMLALLVLAVTGVKYLIDKNLLNKDVDAPKYSDVITRDFPRFGENLPGQAPGVVSDVSNESTSSKLSNKESTLEDIDSIKSALEEDLKKSSETQYSLDKALEERGLSLATPLEFVNDKISSLDQETKNTLDLKSTEFLTKIDNVGKDEVLDAIHVDALHSISPDLKAKVADSTIYHPEYGVLLGKGDLVKAGDSEYGVIGAQDVGGLLVYTLAKDSSDGNYEILFSEAKDVELLGHNVVNFDNASNLESQIQSTLIEKYGEGAPIQKIEILDRSNPDSSALSITQLAAIAPFIRPDMINPDLSKEKPTLVVDVESELANKLANQPMELHTDLSNAEFGNLHGNVHGVYGSLLDINDLVKFEHPTNHKSYDGSVISAFVDKNQQLQYVVKKQDTLFNIPATDLSLIEKNGGTLSNEEIGQIYYKNKEPGASLEKSSKLRIDLKVPDYKLNMNSLGIAIERTPNVNLYGFTPLANPKRLKVSEGKKFAEFMQIGENLNPKTGEKEIVAIRLNKTIRGVQLPKANNAKFEKFSVDNPDVHVQANGFTNKEFIAFAKNMSTVALAGSLKATSHIIDKFKPVVDRAIYKNINANELAMETYAKNAIATQLLQDEFNKSIGKDVDATYGKSADLSQSVFNDNAVNNIISNPDSVSAIGDQSLAESPKTLNDNMDNFGFYSDINVEAYNDMSLNDDEINLDSYDHQSNTMDDHRLGNFISDLQSSAPESSPIETLINQAKSLVPLSTNLEASNLSVRQSMFMDVEDISSRMSGFFEVLDSNVVPNLHNSRLAPDMDIHKQINEIPDIELKISNVREAIEDYRSGFDESLRKLGQDYQLFLQNNDVADFNNEKFDTFSKEYEQILDEVKQEISAINRVDEFISNVEDFYYTSNPYNEVVGSNNQKFIANEAKYEAIVAPLSNVVDRVNENNKPNENESRFDHGV